MVASRATEVYRRTTQAKDLTASEREQLVKPFLPSPRSTSPVQRQTRTKPVRTFLKGYLYHLTYTAIHILFFIYIWFRQTYHALLDRAFSILYYHHRTPELIRRDVNALSRLPGHLSVILAVADDAHAGKELERLMDKAAEMAAWCASAGIPILSIYEKTGLLKSYIPQTHRAMSSKLHTYFGRRRPSLQLGAPHVPAYLNGDIFVGDRPSLVSYGELCTLLVHSIPV